MVKHDPEWEEWQKIMEANTAAQQKASSKQGGKSNAIDMNAVMVAMSKMMPETDEGITTRDEQISEHVKVRIYTPPGFSKGQSPPPIMLFMHGGGWVIGNLDTEDHTCRTVCGRNKIFVVSVDYRLAPKNKFPIPIDDCYTAYAWTLQNASNFGGDIKRIITSGGSAGAGLAIATTYRIVNNKKPVAGLVVLASFSLHKDAVPEKYKSLHTSYVDNGGDDVQIVKASDAQLAYKGAGALPPYADHSWFPQTGGAEALRGFPPTYIYNTDLECMRDDGRVLEAELQDIGVAVRREVQKGFPHYFWIFPIEKAGDVFRDMLVGGVDWVIEQTRSPRAAL